MLKSPSPRNPASFRQRGLSIVELMVGMTVGLIVVAAASLAVATQLADNRRLMLETQVQQDLRAAADIITRDLRRAGYWRESARQVWAENAPSSTNLKNPRRLVTPSSGEGSLALYEYDRGTFESQFGFCLDSACPTAPPPGAIRAKFAPPAGSVQWHTLTDDKAVIISALTISSVNGPAVQVACPLLCAGGDDTSCWPTLTVRELLITITGRAASDASVQRTVTSRVRVRNDLMTLSAPGASAGESLPCPKP